MGVHELNESTESTPEAQCPRHPERVADAVCERCGTFMCPGCTVVRENERLCPDCARRKGGLGGSWLAVSAGILSFISLACAPLGLVAILLAGIDLVSMAVNDKRGRHGLKLDLIAIGLSVVGIVLGIVVFMRAAADASAAP